MITRTDNPQQSLFRPESIRSRELTWQGKPALSLSLPAAFSSLASAALAVAIVALIIFGSYARRVDMEGTVLPSAGLMAVSSPSAGWVTALAVQEGQAVERGTLLYTLDLDTKTKDGKTQQQIINTQTAEQEMLTQQVDRKTRMSQEGLKQLKEKSTNLKAQIEQIDKQVAMHEGFFKTLDKEYNLFLTLVRRGQAALHDLDSRQQAWMQSQSKLQELESGKLRLIGELGDAQYQITNIAISTADEIDALRNRILDIDEKRANSEAHRSIEIRAPEGGMVTAIVAHPGQVVSIGTPMLKIIPEDAFMNAELLAPNSAIGFIRQNDRVLLRYSAFPYQKFGEYWGTVVTVSDAALTPEEVQSLLAGGGQPTKQGMPPGALSLKEAGPFYRVIVKPDSQFVNVYGEVHKLHVNMRVQAYALLDRRPLYQWIFEPLYDVGRAAHGH
jgi:membrane fusion protein